MKPSPQPDPQVEALHCCVAPDRNSKFEIPNSYSDPYAAPIHRRIDALLLVFCIGLCAVLLTSAYAKRNAPSSSPSDEVAAATAYAKHRSVRQSSPNEQGRGVTLVSSDK